MIEVDSADAVVAPDLTEYVVGYREWFLFTHEGVQKLLPTICTDNAHHKQWTSAHMQARCFVLDYALVPGERETCTHPPGHLCSCGLYADHEVNNRVGYACAYDRLWTGHITGVVRAWGVIEAHRDGFRAEHMEMLAIYKPAQCDCAEDVRRWRERQRRLGSQPLQEVPGFPEDVVFEQLSEQFGVPVVTTLGDLQGVARLHGAPIPKSLRGDNQ